MAVLLGGAWMVRVVWVWLLLCFVLLAFFLSLALLLFCLFCFVCLVTSMSGFVLRSVEFRVKVH